MEGLGFWIFMGLFFAAAIVAGSREKIERQRTLQRLIERNQEIDQELLNRLLGKPRPGVAYRVLRAIGAFVMVTTIPLGIVAALIRISEGAPTAISVRFGVLFAMLPFVVGLALFIASRFCERPDTGSNTGGADA